MSVRGPFGHVPLLMTPSPPPLHPILITPISPTPSLSLHPMASSSSSPLCSRVSTTNSHLHVRRKRLAARRLDDLRWTYMVVAAHALLESSSSSSSSSSSEEDERRPSPRRGSPGDAGYVNLLRVGEPCCKYENKPFLYHKEKSSLLGGGTATAMLASSSIGFAAPRTTGVVDEDGGSARPRIDGKMLLRATKEVCRYLDRKKYERREEIKACIRELRGLCCVEERKKEEIKACIKESKGLCYVTPLQMGKLIDALAKKDRRLAFLAAKDDPEQQRAWVQRVLKK